jgi:hypothetical protein
LVSDHPELDVYSPDANLVVLHVPDEITLLERWSEARQYLRTSLFREPDIGNEATALAVEPHDGKSLRSLPLAFKEPLMAF